MKRANREINIFSMSALDLFASALGAFIVVSLVLFPYFPNTGEAPPSSIDSASAAGVSPAEIEALRRQLAGAEAELDAVRSRERAHSFPVTRSTTHRRRCRSCRRDLVIRSHGQHAERNPPAGRDRVAELLVRLADDDGRRRHRLRTD